MGTGCWSECTPAPQDPRKVEGSAAAHPCDKSAPSLPILLSFSSASPSLGTELHLLSGEFSDISNCSMVTLTVVIGVYHSATSGGNSVLAVPAWPGSTRGTP